MVRFGRALVAIVLALSIILSSCAQEQIPQQEPELDFENPEDQLVELLQLTDEQLQPIRSGTGILQLREDQIALIREPVEELAEELERLLDEARWQEVKSTFNRLIDEGEADMEELGRVADDLYGIGEVGAGVYGVAVLERVAEGTTDAGVKRIASTGQTEVTTIYTPRDTPTEIDEGEKDFDFRRYWGTKVGFGEPNYGATANRDTGLVFAYSKSWIGSDRGTALLGIEFDVPADNTDVSIVTTIRYFTATGSVGIVTTQTNVAKEFAGRFDAEYHTIDHWLSWELAGSVICAALSPFLPKLLIACGISALTEAGLATIEYVELAQAWDNMEGVEEREIPFNAGPLDRGSYSFFIGLHARTSSCVAGYATAAALGQVTQIEVTQSFREEAVHFPDPNLEAAIREAIDKPTGEIYTSDLQGLTHLLASHRNITDLTGLEYCINLTYLALGRNQISDISPLADLTNLEHLRLDYNGLADIAPVANLVDLTWLELRGNHISELWPLSNLTKLTYLHLGDNQLSEISHLEGLTNVTLLYLDQNQISDISALEGLTNLTGLDLYDNEIGDISALAYLTQLQSTQLQDNQISDIKPLVDNPGLGGGDYVDLRNNPLSTTSRNTHIPALQARGVTVDY